MGTKRVRIDNDLYYIESQEDYLELIEQKVGWDARDRLEEMLNMAPDNCTGECDYTYEIQEKFESDIDNALRYLEAVECKNDLSDKNLKRAIMVLETAGI